MLYLKRHFPVPRAVALVVGIVLFAVLATSAYGPSGKVQRLATGFYRIRNPAGNGSPVEVLDRFTEIKKLVYINRHFIFPLYGADLKRRIVHALSSNNHWEGIVDSADWLPSLDRNAVDAVLVNSKSTWGRYWRNGVDDGKARQILLRGGWRILWEDEHDAILIHPRHASLLGSSHQSGRHSPF